MEGNLASSSISTTQALNLDTAFLTSAPHFGHAVSGFSDIFCMTSKPFLQ
jgi:hypothetical protein